MKVSDEGNKLIQKLFNSSLLYQSFFKENTDCIIFTENFKIIDSNYSANQLLNSDKNLQLSGIFPYDFFSATDKKFRSNAITKLTTNLLNKVSTKLELKNNLGKDLNVEIRGIEYKVNNRNIIQLNIYQTEISSQENFNGEFQSDENLLYLLSQSLKCINECVSITDINDNILFVNKSFTELYGYTFDELIGKNISIVRSPDANRNISSNILSQTISSGWKGEILNRKKNGEDFLISLSTTVISNENGEPIGLVGVASDISLNKQLENKLKASEERFRLIFENQTDGVSIVDHDEIFILANRAAESIFGVDEGELIGKNLLNYIPEIEHLKIFEETSNRKSNKKSVYELEIISHDNTAKTLLVNAIPYVSVSGTFKGTLGVFKDITAQKEAEKKIYESEKKYRTLVESMQDGVYRSTPEGKFIEVNNALVNILGYENIEELLEIDIKKDLYFKPEDRESLVLSENKGLDVYPLKKKDGTAVWLEDHGRYVKDETGKILYHEGILRDVSERRKAELQLLEYSEELEELNSTKDKFFSIIAHDLKSPFNSIIGLSEFIKDEAKSMEVSTIESYADVINSTAKNTFLLLNNLLEWAQIQQSTLPFRPEAVLINRIIKEVLELTKEKIISKNIDIVNSIDDKITVTADIEMLRSIFRNLISNALKFTPKGGCIKLSARASTTEILISVSDTGIGMNKTDQEKIFKIDSKFTRRGTENETGSGIGLSLCKEFIEKHDGKIWVESEELKGSTFKISIPNSF